jgi:endonuclease/exonuclease/phosphatase family metal-dependent hydrolase
MNDNNSSAKQTHFTSIALIAITTLIGMQMIRALVPSFLFVLRDRLDMSTPIVAVVAVLIFLTAFLAGPVNKFLGSMPTFIISAIVLGFTRLALQLWGYDPIGDMILAATGVIAFLLFLPVALGLARRVNGQATLNMGIGLLAGMALDLALNGAFLSYDLSWQSGWLPTIIVILIVGGQWLLIGRLLRDDFEAETADAPFKIGISWIFLGPYIFLQLLIFANIAWATTTTSLPFTAAFALLLLGQLAGLATLLLPGPIFRLLILITAALALLLSILFLAAGPQAAWVTILYLFIGQIALSGLLLAIMRALAEEPRLSGLRNITIAHGLGMLLLVIFLFVYYAVYDLPLPFSNTFLSLTAFLIVLLAGVPGLWVAGKGTLPVSPTARWFALGMLLLLLIPLGQGITWQQPQTTTPGGDTIRVMTYNLHNGADPKGHLGLEAIAQIIEREDPDVVGLQEVSRGWVVNGSVDMLTWLSQRLDMVPVFGPAADAQWGNAVLTRLPVEAYENIPLPTEDLLLKRAFMALSLDRGAEQPLTFINTHYHHKSDGGAIREEQSQAILDYWNGAPITAVMGDLNAEHGDREIDLYGEAEFGDVLDLTGVVPGYTNPVPDPYRRIDYVFITPDLEASAGVVPTDEASDHLPIAVTINN